MSVSVTDERRNETLGHRLPAGLQLLKDGLWALCPLTSPTLRIPATPSAWQRSQAYLSAAFASSSFQILGKEKEEEIHLPFTLFSQWFTKQTNIGYHWKDCCQLCLSQDIIPSWCWIFLANARLALQPNCVTMTLQSQCWDVTKIESIWLATNQLFQQFSFTYKNASNLRHELVFLESLL